MALSLSLALAALAGLATGPLALSIGELFTALLRHDDGDRLAREVLWNLRVPRVLLAMIVGAGLAVGGAVLQGLFRNPLADPGLIGVSAGGALGAVAMIVLGGTVWAPIVGVFSGFAIPLAAFVGASVATLLVYAIARRDPSRSVATLILAGIAINAIAGAVTGLFVFLADDQQLRTITFWNMGSLASGAWPMIIVAGLASLALIAATRWLAPALDALMLGERSASHLGFAVDRVTVVAIVLVAAAVGASVAVAGIIGFVGLVVPHLLRLWVGPSHRYLLPGSALGGALLLLLADIAARTVIAPAELPIGLLTALLGGPFFLWLLLRMRRRFT
ncbi:MAG: FecCD family ABC transporter permease [Thioalkalivibrionaceae bacterium]